MQKIKVDLLVQRDHGFDGIGIIEQILKNNKYQKLS